MTRLNNHVQYPDMRIIAGTAKGRRLKSPAKNLPVRPALDRIREAIFSIIGTTCPDWQVLDLYAGSGAYGLEALSRGAKRVDFVEENPQVVKLIESNLSLCGFQNQGVVHHQSVEQFLKQSHVHPFQLIFLDPPFKDDTLPQLLKEIDKHKLLAETGFLVARCSRHSNMEFTQTYKHMHLHRDRVYGESRVLVYQQGQS